MMSLKIIHVYLLKLYLPLFFITLFIGNFIYFLIYLYTYLDEIIGKGINIWPLTQFCFYSFISFFPVSVVLAILLSSIMCFGNLAENYELSALKSSGQSLFKIIKPIFVFIVGLAILMFIFNNFSLPHIIVKSSRLLYDIRQTKPSLNIKEGIYSNQIEGYTLKVGKKSADGKKLFNISLYDQSNGYGNIIQMYSDSGYIATSNDKNYLNFCLQSGIRYEDMVQDQNYFTKKPTMQIQFSEMTFNMDLSAFKMKNSDDNLFKNDIKMMNIWMINNEIDSTLSYIYKKKQDLKQNLNTYYLTHCNDFLYDTLLTHKVIFVKQMLKQISKDEQFKIYEYAQHLVRNFSSLIDSIDEEIDINTTKINEFKAGWHKKIAMSLVCIILSFIGLALGAIIKKGGMGLPTVVAVLFFLVYYITSIIFERLVYNNTFLPIVGIWAPPLFFLIVACLLFYRAAKEVPLFSFSFKKLQTKTS